MRRCARWSLAITQLVAAVANEEHATLLLKELKADYELIKVRKLRPLVARLTPVRSAAGAVGDQDQSRCGGQGPAAHCQPLDGREGVHRQDACSKVSCCRHRSLHAADGRRRYDAIIEPLVRAPNPMREEFIAFLGHIGELADGLKVKQIKADIMAEIDSREAEAANYQRIPLSAYILPAKEFLLQDPDWAAALADITRGVEPEHWKETAAKAQVFFRDKLPADILSDAMKSIENQTKRMESEAASAAEASLQETAEVTLTLNAAFDDIPEGSQQREDFKKNVLMDIAQSLGALPPFVMFCCTVSFITHCRNFRRLPRNHGPPARLHHRQVQDQRRCCLAPRAALGSRSQSSPTGATAPRPLASLVNMHHNRPLLQAQQADSALMTGLVTSSTKGLEAETKAPSHLRAAAAAALFASPAKVVVPSPRHMSPAALSPRTPLTPSASSEPPVVKPSSPAPGPTIPSSSDGATDVETSNALQASRTAADAPPDIHPLTLADLHAISGAAADSQSSPHSAASSYRSTASAKDKAAARAEKARMYKLQREQEEEALRSAIAAESKRPASGSTAPDASALVAASAVKEAGAEKQYALPEDSRSLAVLDVLNRQKMAEMTLAAFTGSNAEFYEQPVSDPVCDIRFKSDDAYDDSFEVGGSATKDYLYHPQVLMVMSYKDFVEERRDMRRYVWPDVTALVNDFGYAFRPVDPWIGCNTDAAAFSADCMNNALEGTVSAQFWLFLFGSTYGYVPPLAVMSACSKRYPWYDAFR